ncbi:archaeosortase A [Halobacteria archaeon AArc-curdl1]|uniref:Archaeosortase A n=1 Tax=Natronosalvus hydrolyticus TaxID=2979988 RepID=A0AAP3E4Q9_9EURY|nr:archaeosortase A [Halobacteria archaeon AArc-curdl1]
MSSTRSLALDAGAFVATSSVLSGFLTSVSVSDVLAWVSIAGFLAALVFSWQRRSDLARYVGSGSWILFGLFWLTMVPYYYTDAQSPIQTVLSLVALPLCAYTGYLLYNGRLSLLTLTKAVAVMGLIYLPVETIPFVRQWLIETTATQAHFGMELLGYSPGINEGANGYQSRFDFDPNETVTGRTTYIVLACTGIGSMAIFGGLIASVKAPLKRKASAFVLAVGVIWFLNFLRNVFIALASPYGWFQYDALIYITTTFMGAPENRTSFLVAHNFIAQSLSIVALVGITYMVIKILPEILGPLEEALFVITGTEYDLYDALADLDGAPVGEEAVNPGDD